MSEYFLDTNIFMYAAGKPHKFKEPCVAIIFKVQSGELTAAIDTEVFQEVLYRYHHINLSDKGRDIIHIATMMQNGIEKIVSVDKHFDVIEEVERINPFKLS